MHVGLLRDKKPGCAESRDQTAAAGGGACSIGSPPNSSRTQRSPNGQAQLACGNDRPARVAKHVRYYRPSGGNGRPQVGAGVVLVGRDEDVDILPPMFGANM